MLFNPGKLAMIGGVIGAMLLFKCSYAQPAPLLPSQADWVPRLTAGEGWREEPPQGLVIQRYTQGDQKVELLRAAGGLEALAEWDAQFRLQDPRVETRKHDPQRQVGAWSGVEGWVVFEGRVGFYFGFVLPGEGGVCFVLVEGPAPEMEPLSRVFEGLLRQLEGQSMP